MNDLERRIEALEESAWPANAEPMVLVLVDAGTKSLPTDRNASRIEVAQAKAAGRASIVVNLPGGFQAARK